LSKTDETLVNDRGLAVDALSTLLDRPVEAPVAPAGRERIPGAVVGTLVAFADEGRTPLVVYRGQPGTAAVRARATISLDGSDIGRDAVLMFEDGEPTRPIIVGCLQNSNGATLTGGREEVDVEADGERLVVSAKERIVLRCGKASITLTKEGKLILQGAYVSSQSSGVLRIKGGSVHIN
jgi:hypothetical protein